jgi:hypothetical protein
MDRLGQTVRGTQTVQDVRRTVHLEGDHTVVHGRETGGNRLVRPWVRGDDMSSDDDIGVWRLMELSFDVA